MEYSKLKNTQYPHVFGSSRIDEVERFFITSNVVGVVLAAEKHRAPAAQDLFFYQFMSSEFKDWLTPHLGNYQLSLLIGRAFNNKAGVGDYHFCVCFRYEEDALLFKLRFL